MLLHSAHHHLVAVGRDVLADGQLRAHLAPQLVEERKLHVRPAHHLARRRREPSGQQVEERRLARAVRAEDADPLAAQHRGREVRDHRFLRTGIGEGEVLRLQHARAAGRGGVEPHRRRSRGSPPRRELLAQLHQRRDAPLVARRPRLHSAADPRLLLGELPRLPLPVYLLVRQQLRLALQERRIVAFPARELAAVEVEYLRRHPPQEAAVVRDHDHGHVARASQHPLQPVDRLHVEVVGGLVQEQQVRARQ